MRNFILGALTVLVLGYAHKSHGWDYHSEQALVFVEVQANGKTIVHCPEIMMAVKIEE